MIKEIERERKKFFSSCHFLAKAPGSYFWTGEHSVMYGQLAIIHAVPLYLYVGIETGDFSNFEYELKFIKDETNIGSEKVEFNDIEGIGVDSWEDKSKVEEFLKNWKDRTGNNYFKLKIWSEIPPKCGLNSSGAFAVSLSMLLYMIEKKQKEKDLNKIIYKWRNKPIEQLKKDKAFIEIFRTAWALDDCFHFYSSSGAGPFSSLIGSQGDEIILYFSEKKGFYSDSPIRRIPRKDEILDSQFYESYIEKINKLEFWGKRLPIPAWIKNRLGCCLIFCGKAKDTGWVLEELGKWFNNSILEFSSLFNHYFGDINFYDYENKLSRPINDFVKDFPEESASDEYFPKTIFTESLGLLSWALLQSIESGNAKIFQQRIKDIHKFLSFYNLIFEKNLNACYQAIMKIDENIAVKLTGAGGGGDLLVFGNRDVIKKVEMRLAEEGKYKIHYSSRNMGWLAEPISMITYKEAQSWGLGERDKIRKEYEVYIDGVRDYKTRREVEDLELRKSEFLAWAWLDDEKSEIIVDKKQKDIKPESVLSRYFCSIIKRVGKDLLHTDIEKEVITTDIHQNLNRLKKKTDHVLDDYIEAKGGRFTIHPFKACLITKMKNN